MSRCCSLVIFTCHLSFPKKASRNWLIIFPFEAVKSILSKTSFLKLTCTCYQKKPNWRLQIFNQISMLIFLRIGKQLSKSRDDMQDLNTIDWWFPFTLPWLASVCSCWDNAIIESCIFKMHLLDNYKFEWTYW